MPLLTTAKQGQARCVGCGALSDSGVWSRLPGRGARFECSSCAGEPMLGETESRDGELCGLSTDLEEVR